MREPFRALPRSLSASMSLLDDVGRHPRVDLTGELDEAGGHAVLAGLPGQVERVDRDAVAAEPGARIERLEAERLGLGRLDHVPHVDAHPLEGDLQLVDQGDVHRPVDVLEDLGGLRHPRRGDRHDLLDGLARRASWPGPGRSASCPPTTFGMVAVSNWALPGSSRSGEKARKKSSPTRRPRASQPRQDDLVRGAGIGRALQAHELVAPQRRRHRVRRLLDESQVGIAMLGQRRGHADDDGIGLGQTSQVSGGLEAPRGEQGLHARAGTCWM